MSDKYKHPKWQKKRLEVLSRDEWKCVACGDAESTLHVHHKMYRPGEIWDTEAEMLQSLCEPCHKALGDHPKGGVFWHPGNDGVPASVCVAWCPVCAGKKFKYKGSWIQCCECEWDTSNYSHLSIASSIIVTAQDAPAKPPTHSLAWLKGIGTKVRKGGATDNDIFLAMFPESASTNKLLLAIKAMKDGIEAISKGEMDVGQEVALAREAIHARHYISLILSAPPRDDFELFSDARLDETQSTSDTRDPLNDWMAAGSSVGGLAVDFCELVTKATWREDVLEVVIASEFEKAAMFLARPEIALRLNQALSEIVGRPVSHAFVMQKEATDGR